MKLIFALAAAGFGSSLMVATLASAQKDPACMEKCNRDNPRTDPGLFQQQRGTAVRNCIQACPRAKGAAKK
jgi:hypothetical protein